jgi:hypothetical protein
MSHDDSWMEHCVHFAIQALGKTARVTPEIIRGVEDCFARVKRVRELERLLVEVRADNAMLIEQVRQVMLERGS